MSADLEHIRQIMREADCLYTEAQVEEAIAKVGAHISREMADTNPVVFCVMNGGLIFAGKLLTHLQFPLEASYLHATRYRNETSGGDLFWKAKPEVSFIDRDVLIIDDVITAGTAIREVMQIIASQDGAKAAGVLIALNRQERGNGELSAIQEVERDFAIPVVSIVSLNQVLQFLEDDPQLKQHLPAVKAYREQFGV